MSLSSLAAELRGTAPSVTPPGPTAAVPTDEVGPPRPAPRLLTSAPAANRFDEVYAAVELEMGRRPDDPTKAAAYGEVLRREVLQRMFREGRGVAGEPPRPTGVVALEEFAKRDLPEVRDRVDGLIPAVGLSAIIGAPKAGKSLLMLQVGLCVASGIRFFGRETDRCATLLVEEEGSLAHHQKRLERMRSGGVGRAPAARELYVAYREGYRIDTPTGIERLRRAILDTGAKLTLMGPLAQLAGLESENDAAIVNKVMRELNGLASETESCIVIAHHRRKPDKRAGAPGSATEYFDTIRGSSAFLAALDSGIGLYRDHGAETGWMYVINREAESGRYAYQFDVDTLQVFPTDPPDAAKLSRKRALALLAEHGELGYAKVRELTGVGENTARNVLTALEEDGLVERIRRERGRAVFMPSDAGWALVSA